jgi:hypothetical protein
MKAKRTAPAHLRARKTAGPRRRRVVNPLPPADRRLGKKLLQFYELPEPKPSRAFDAWLNSAGTPKRNAERKRKTAWRVIRPRMHEPHRSRDRRAEAAHHELPPIISSALVLFKHNVFRLPESNPPNPCPAVQPVRPPNV